MLGQGGGRVGLSSPRLAQICSCVLRSGALKGTNLAAMRWPGTWRLCAQAFTNSQRLGYVARLSSGLQLTVKGWAATLTPLQNDAAFVNSHGSVCSLRLHSAGWFSQMICVEAQLGSFLYIYTHIFMDLFKSVFDLGCVISCPLIFGIQQSTSVKHALKFMNGLLSDLFLTPQFRMRHWWGVDYWFQLELWLLNY